MALKNSYKVLPFRCVRSQHPVTGLISNAQQCGHLDERKCFCRCMSHLSVYSKNHQSNAQSGNFQYFRDNLMDRQSNRCVKRVHTSVNLLTTISDKNNTHTKSATDIITNENSDNFSTGENTISVSNESLYDSDEDKDIRPALDAQTPTKPPVTFVNIVPGKGPPPEPPVDCCMSGCANCVWIQYAEELKNYFSLEEGSIKAKEAIEQIDNAGLQMFLKLELGLL